MILCLLNQVYLHAFMSHDQRSSSDLKMSQMEGQDEHGRFPVDNAIMRCLFCVFVAFHVDFCLHTSIASTKYFMAKSSMPLVVKIALTPVSKILWIFS